MHLLVSVANADDAAAAIAGGADIVDAKDPSQGSLGAVVPVVLEAIRRQVAEARPLSAALGDGIEEWSVEQAAGRTVRGGLAFVKIGFAGVRSAARVGHLLAAARRGAGSCAVVAVAYADAERTDALDPYVVLDCAARAGAAGVLLDTADKAGPGLCALLTPALMRAWVATARHAGLQVALAGKLTRADMPIVLDAGPDVIGVRGAVCDGHRGGRVVSAKVRDLVELVGRDRSGHDAGWERPGEVRIDALTR